MHTDDHILEHLLAAKHPLPALATHLGMTLIALVHWVDRNADLLAAAKRSLETHLAFLALNAEAAALIDLTEVSRSTTNEERKRKSSSQLLRHAAKRLLTAVGSSSPFSPQGGEKSLSAAKGMRGSHSAHSLTNLAGSFDQGVSPPSPRLDGEKVPSGIAARGMRGTASAPDALSESTLPRSDMQSTPTLNFSDHEIDVLMATLARHFNIDLTAPDADEQTNPQGEETQRALACTTSQ